MGITNKDVLKTVLKVPQLEEQLDSIAYQNYKKDDFIKMIRSGEITSVDFIGDSITAGVGSTGHTVPSDGRIIFTHPTTNEVFRESNYTCRSWSNMLREYLISQGVSVFNRGIGGKSTKFAMQFKELWVRNADCIFVQLGTNDRWDNVSLEQYKQDITNFLAYVKSKCKLMIVMSAPPTLNDYLRNGDRNSDYKFTMQDVDKVITDVCIANKYPHISHYREFQKEVTRVNPSYFLQTFEQGSHPIDSGYELMYKTILKELNISESIASVKELGILNFNKDQLQWGFDKPITDDIYKIGGTTIFEISSSHPDVARLPLGSSGTIIAYRGYADNRLYNYQEYHIRQANKRFIRYWNYTTSDWSAFQSIIIRDVPKRETITITNLTIPANTRNTTYVTPTKFGLVTSSVYSMSPQTLTPTGIIFAGYRVDGTNNRFQLAFDNITSNPVTITSYSFNVSEVISE